MKKLNIILSCIVLSGVSFISCKKNNPNLNSDGSVKINPTAQFTTDSKTPVNACPDEIVFNPQDSPDKVIATVGDINFLINGYSAAPDAPDLTLSSIKIKFTSASIEPNSSDNTNTQFICYYTLKEPADLVKYGYSFTAISNANVLKDIGWNNEGVGYKNCNSIPVADALNILTCNDTPNTPQQ